MDLLYTTDWYLDLHRDRIGSGVLRRIGLSIGNKLPKTRGQSSIGMIHGSIRRGRLLLIVAIGTAVTFVGVVISLSSIAIKNVVASHVCGSACREN